MLKETSLNILMMPDCRVDNPYQTLLAGGLQASNVKVTFPQGYRRILPFFRAVQSSPIPVDVIHLHWTGPYLKGANWVVRLVYSLKFLLDIWLTRQSGVRVVWTVHNSISHNAQFPSLELWTYRRLVRVIDGVIVHSRAASKEITLLYHLKDTSVTVIPHGHFRDVYLPPIDKYEARRELNLPAEEKIFLNFGLLRPYKGVEKLFEIWKTHCSISDSATLLIAGQALEPSYGEALSNHAHQSQGIIFCNKHIPDDQVHLYFSAADSVVLPFNKILTSGSLLLAMSYQRPVIAPRLGGVAEAVGPADWFLYDPQDPQGLLHAVKDCLEADLKERGKVIDEVCNRLSWNVIGQKTKDLYQAIGCHKV